MKTIFIIGAGGVGGYFGGKLAQAGFNITLVARGAHFKAIKKYGLKVNSLNGDFVVHPINVVETVVECPKADLIIVAVKAWQVAEVAKQLSPILKPETVILPLQNGVLAADELKAHINPSQVLYGLCRIISLIEQPGVISHVGVEPTILLGEANNEQSERIMDIKNLLTQAGIKTIVPNDILADVWKKFISINVSALLAITRTNYGEMRSIPETRVLMIELLNEVYRVSQAKGINIEQNFIDKTVAFIDTFPPETTSSLTRDVWEGKPSEIEYQNGCVVKMANALGLDVPINRFVYHCILPMELKARKAI